jgi:hypothetical protein
MADSFVLYCPSQKEEQLLKNHFLSQARQSGFGSGFVGLPYQRGNGLGSIFGTIFKAVAPLAKSALRTVGKSVLKTGLSVAGDALSGRNVVESMEDHGRSAAANLVRKASKRLTSGPKVVTVATASTRKPRRKGRKQKGRGLGRRKASPQYKSIKGSKKRHKEEDIFG